MEQNKRKKHWAETEKKFLRHNYQELPDKEIAAKLEKSIYSVRWMAT